MQGRIVMKMAGRNSAVTSAVSSHTESEMMTLKARVHSTVPWAKNDRRIHSFIDSVIHSFSNSFLWSFTACVDSSSDGEFSTTARPPQVMTRPCAAVKCFHRSRLIASSATHRHQWPSPLSLLLLLLLLLVMVVTLMLTLLVAFHVHSLTHGLQSRTITSFLSFNVFLSKLPIISRQCF